MKTLPWLTAILFIGCLVMGYILFSERNAVVQITVSRDAADRDYKDAHTRISELEHQLAESKAAVAFAEKQAAKATSDAAAVAPRPQSASPKNATTIIRITDILKDHPEYAALYAKQTRRNIDRMYSNGLSTLNLPPDQLSHLKDLLAERQMNNMDAQAAASAAGLVPGTPEWQEAMKLAAQDTQQQVNAILGSDADATLARLQARASFQNQVDMNYSHEFADAGAPMSLEQSSALVQAMADANYAGKDLSTRPAGYNDPDPATGLTPHDTRILDSASQVLSPAQIQILKSDLADNNKVNAIMSQYIKPGTPSIIVQ